MRNEPKNAVKIFTRDGRENRRANVPGMTSETTDLADLVSLDAAIRDDLPTNARVATIVADSVITHQQSPPTKKLLISSNKTRIMKKSLLMNTC